MRDKPESRKVDLMFDGKPLAGCGFREQLRRNEIGQQLGLRTQVRLGGLVMASMLPGLDARE
ncbi:hypothetical protein [Paraburkholderia hospita]|uniref:hypothetical protein n=1 Tax=Paraburkholderia hospita TaxID=169430 RepID=UPI000DEEC5B3|nr:hypothetical protein [Paraburkholderia hospita]AXF05806.1 hypothetical protein CUJ88_46195 [Paraburkholderia hospita]